MKFQKILLDIDNTIYDYESTHQLALSAIKQFFLTNFGVLESDFVHLYSQARKIIHINLSETASAHNRLLYFQKLLELIKINPLKYALTLYNLYWDTFINNIKFFDGVVELLTKYRNNICFLTDLTADIQLKKINLLNLDQYANCIVTSEEAGKEKPHPFIFHLALEKLKIQKYDVCMIGDSYSKDIVGAINLEIKSIWLNRTNEKREYDPNLVVEVNEFHNILNLV